MGRPILTEEKLRMIRNVCGDDTIDVFWNNHQNCYQIVQLLPGYRPTDPRLLGTPIATGTHTRYKYLVDLVSADGHRIEPSPLWVKLALDTKTIRADDPMFDKIVACDFDAGELESRPFEQLVEEEEIMAEAMEDVQTYGIQDRKHIRLSG